MSRDTPKRIGIRRSPELNRAVYQRFLESDYPEALRLAELVLEENPDDAIAQAVRDQCVLALRKDTVPAPATVKDGVVPPDDDTSPQLLDDDDDDEPTGPTLSLANRNDATRELYRLYLASEYAPALALAEDILATGDADAMVKAIASECRVTLDTRRSVPVLSLRPAEISEITPSGLDTHTAFVLAQIDGRLSIEEVADMSGMPLEDVLSLLDRFVAMGVLTLRPPPPPS
jgi:hypothetical protein